MSGPSDMARSSAREVMSVVQVIAEAMDGRKVAAGTPKMIDVLVGCSDGTERWVKEPLFQDSNAPGKPFPFDELEALMSEAEFRPFLRWTEAEALEESALGCHCGGALEPRGFLRSDPRSYRTFAVCTACHRVAFEF